jgi:hypothetical protein
VHCTARSKSEQINKEVPTKSKERSGMSTFSNPLTEYSPQMEFEATPSEEFDGEFEQGVFDEHQEMELAIALLEVANEEQLGNLFLDLIQKASSAIGDPVRSAIGRAICGVLKRAVRQALPLTGRAVEEAKGSPLGARLGRGLASVAGPAMGLELEGLSGEDREFEAIRQFVRFAGETAKIAEDIGPADDPADGAHRAAVKAASVYAPGLTIGGREMWPHIEGFLHGRIALCRSIVQSRSTGEDACMTSIGCSSAIARRWRTILWHQKPRH